jgi:hypothetical protein
MHEEIISTDSENLSSLFFDLLLSAIFITSAQVMIDAAATIYVNSTVVLFFILLTRSRTGTCYDDG